MPKLTTSAPVLLVRDVKASADYFRDCCGFKYDKLWGDPPGFCMVWRDNLCIMLSQTDEPDRIVPNWKIVHHMWNAYFWVDDAKALYDEFSAAGAKIDYELHEKDYGCLEFGIQDLDGHDIAFGQDLDQFPLKA